jgi:acyl-CoA thioester hydrolase
MACFVIEHRVGWADVDMVGIVYFPRFLTFFELAELEWVRSHGFGYREYLDRLGVWLPRVAAHCNYHAPARLDDTMAVEMKVDRLGRTSFTFGFEVFRLPGRTLLADGYIVIASVSRGEFKPVRLPEALVDMLAPLTESSPP